MKPQIHTLPNGLRVLILDTKSFPTLTMLLLVGAGSRYENEKNNGIAHFLEHMFYKGSKNYPDMEIISQEIEGMGGHWNAFTSKDYTGYFIKAATYHFPKMADILADILLHPLLQTEEIEKEKGVIVEEINMYEDTPQRRIADIFENVMYEGSPLGYDIAGTKKTVTSFDRNTFVNYMESLYQPQNAVLVVAGGLSGAGDVLKTVEAKFSHWKRGKAAGYSSFDAKQTGPRFKVAKKQTEQAHFCVGFPTFGIADNRRPILKVLSTLMGGGASSRLFQEVREKRGLCYYISTGVEQYHDTGNIVTQSGVTKEADKVKEALKATMKEHTKLIKGQIKDTDIARSKEMIKGRLLLSMEDSFNVAHFFGLKELHENTMETPEEIMKKIDKVTREEIVALAGEIFTHDNLNFSIIGPFEKESLTVADLEF
ncbi:insulinase family protein [Candidatus Roizmanbacteria bacterium]|nr:insulinase family protein [Candidatus Roizmanbacteria bacterium]